MYSDGYFAIWCHDWIWEFVAIQPFKLNGTVDKSGARNITGFYTTNSAISNTIIVPVFLIYYDNEIFILKGMRSMKKIFYITILSILYEKNILYNYFINFVNIFSDRMWMC